MRTMMSRVIMLMGCGLMMSATAAAEQPTWLQVYGRITMGMQYSDLDDGTGSDTSLTSYASRIGAQGSFALGEELELIYQMEWEVDLDDLKDSHVITPRNQYLGIKGNFGEFSVGRRDTAVKMLQGAFDKFSDFEGDIKHLFAGKNRMNDTFNYFSPKLGQWQVAASYTLENNADNGVSMTVTYGDSKLNDSEYYVGVGVDDAVKGKNIVRAVALTKVGTTQLGMLWQDQENIDGTEQADGFAFNVAQPWRKFKFLLQYNHMDYSSGKRSSWSGGIDYQWLDKTKLYAWYTQRDLDYIDAQQHFTAIGIEHRF